MWQEIVIFILAAGSVWFLARQFFSTSKAEARGTGCGKCSSCSPTRDRLFPKAGE